MSDQGKDRDEYTWRDATSDLALATRLTLREASAITIALQEVDVHPYDAFPHLRTLFDEGPIGARADALKALVERRRPQ